jgi:hypothetical protein
VVRYLPGDVHRHDDLDVYQPQRCGAYQVGGERKRLSYHADPWATARRARRSFRDGQSAVPSSGSPDRRQPTACCFAKNQQSYERPAVAHAAWRYGGRSDRGDVEPCHGRSRGLHRGDNAGLRPRTASAAYAVEHWRSDGQPDETLGPEGRASRHESAAFSWTLREAIDGVGGSILP